MLRRVAAHVTYWLATTPVRISTWWRVRVRREHRRWQVVGSTDIDWTDRVAIVAVHPRHALVGSVRRSLAALRAQQVTTVLVLNESPDRERCAARWRDHADVLLTRPNIGRDFGAYQAGVSFVREHAAVDRIRRVIFLNDSVVHLPTTPRLLGDWLAEATGSSALSVNQIPQPHLQGFAFELDGAVAFGQPLTRFWQRYYPSDIRHRAIRRGELGLSDVLRRGGRTLTGYLSADRLGPSSGGEWEHLLAIGNPSHVAGLAAARKCGFPLKLDLVAVGAATAAEVTTVLRAAGVEDDEVSALDRLFAERGRLGDSPGIRGLWQRAGLW